MPAEKIYYAIIILLSAVSVLLSPFFYVRRSRNGLKITPSRKRQWRAIVAATLITCLILLLVWYFWL